MLEAWQDPPPSALPGPLTAPSPGAVQGEQDQPELRQRGDAEEDAVGKLARSGALQSYSCFSHQPALAATPRGVRDAGGGTGMW